MNRNHTRPLSEVHRIREAISSTLDQYLQERHKLEMEKEDGCIEDVMMEGLTEICAALSGSLIDGLMTLRLYRKASCAGSREEALFLLRQVSENKKVKVDDDIEPIVDLAKEIVLKELKKLCDSKLG